MGLRLRARKPNLYVLVVLLWQWFRHSMAFAIPRYVLVLGVTFLLVFLIHAALVLHKVLSYIPRYIFLLYIHEFAAYDVVILRRGFNLRNMQFSALGSFK